MTKYKNVGKLAIILLALITLPLPGRTRRKKSIPNTNVQHEKVIIIDFGGVLFKEDRNSIVQKIGFSHIARYALSNWQSPVDGCLNTLEKISQEKDQKTHIPFVFRGRAMPQCIVQWQRGEKKYDDVQKELNQYIEKIAKEGYFSSDHEKFVTQSIINISLDPSQLTDITKPVAPMIKVAKQLKEKGYKLLALTNLPHETYDVLKKNYPELIELFESIEISAELHLVKPEKELFTTFLKKHKLDPKQCILIENHEDSVPVAQKLGMTAIHCSNPKACKHKLKEIGLLF